MEAKPVLAVDFGTSNTVVTKCSSDQSIPVGIDFGESRDGLATAILYRKGKEPIVGDKALEEFGDATDSERQTYTIRTQFKPDLAYSDEARKYSCDFLASLIRYATQQHIALELLSRQVIVGAPSEAPKEYHDALKSVAFQSGFGDIQIVDEPIGAIYFHVQSKDITPAEAMQGALVVDFGGGTCDFALVVHGEVKHSWGDMHLGGRLFDDVFYQWFIEQNPDATANMKAEHAEFFVLWFLCRQIKEKFSQLMAMDRTAKFRKAVGEFGRIDNVTWEKFLQRVREYRPSDTFAHYMSEVNPYAMEKFSLDSAVDILEWFRQSLRKGLQHEHVCQHKVACIILTGGSSSWPFVPEIVEEEMASIDVRPRMVRSDRPYATISEGLSILPSLQHRFTAVQDKLRKETPTFIKEKLHPLAERRIEESAERIADSIAVSLFDQRIKPILLDFRQKGGAVASLKQRIAQQSESFKPQIESIVEREIMRAFTALAVEAIELMIEWFREHDLIFQRRVGKLEKNPITTLPPFPPIDIFATIAKIITLVSIGIISTLYGSSTELAIFTTGPLGLVIGVIISLIIGALVATIGVENAKRRAENWDGCPLWIIRKALSEKKIFGIREDLKRLVKEKTLEQTSEAKKKLEQQIRKYVDDEIEALSAINQI